VRYWDWTDWAICGLGALFAAFVVLIGFGIWYDITSEKIVITKADWNCTNTETTTHFILIGKILTPQSFTRCVEYKKNGD
jgi:hypothetical protein